MPGDPPDASDPPFAPAPALLARDEGPRSDSATALGLHRGRSVIARSRLHGLAAPRWIEPGRAR